MHLKHLAVGAAVYLALLIAAPAGSAQTAAQPGYSTPAGSVQQEVRGGHDPRPAAVAAKTRGGSLPFSGLDLGLVGAVGAALLVLGVGVRRLSRPPTS